MIGRIVSHYKIFEKLGEGGMGVVYKAQDIKLKRTVALKFLPPELTKDPEAKKRFIHEAQAASALDHSNICIIHEINETEDGQVFIAMACYEGKTLKEKIAKSPLPISESINMAIQMAQGLQEAHDKKIVHRDIKSANVIVTDKGQIKIMDFGLAKLTGQTVLTKEGSTLGTMAYMSPEQAQGKKVDARSDIWSLGVVLYEMLTGKCPFTGDYDQAVIYSILNEDPEPVTGVRTGVPMELEQIIRKCLEKNPADRYHRVDELLVDLRRVIKTLDGSASPSCINKAPGKKIKRIIPYAIAGMALLTLVAALIHYDLIPTGKTVSDTDRKTLVVLPFKNMGPAEDAYFTIGITDEITSRLGTIPRIGVISRNSASHYADKAWNTKQVGKELHVEYIVAGTVRWARSTEADDKVRITPRLIRVSDDVEIWSKSFDQVIHDIFEIQSEIAMQVVEQLGITLGKSERRTIEQDPTRHLDAYQAFLQGRHLSRSPHFTVDNWLRVIQSYERAVELDPASGVAFAELARAHARLHFLRHDLSEKRLIMAKNAAEKAMALAPDSPEVLLSLGYYHLWADRDREKALHKWTQAEKELPNDPRILEAKAQLCANMGHWDEGIADLEKALKYSPGDQSMITDLALFYWMKRQYTRALELCNQAIAMAPDENWPYIYKTIMIWNVKGANQESKHALESVNPEYHWMPWLWFWQEAREGRYDQALRRLADNPDGWISQKLWARPKTMFKAFIYDFMDEPELARKSYEASILPLEDMVKKWPNDPRYHSSLGMAYAAMGRKEEAIEEGKKAIDALPLSKDAEYGQAYEMDMIIIDIMVHEYDAAMDKIEFMLSMPSWLSVGWMKFDLRYKPLYGHPRFEKLVHKYKRNRS